MAVDSPGDRGSMDTEACESGRIGTIGNRVWGNSPWVQIPPPPLCHVSRHTETPRTLSSGCFLFSRGPSGRLSADSPGPCRRGGLGVAHRWLHSPLGAWKSSRRGVRSLRLKLLIPVVRRVRSGVGGSDVLRPGQPSMHRRRASSEGSTYQPACAWCCSVDMGRKIG